MEISNKIFLLSFCLLSYSKLQAQGGGPPMLTDDPGVVDLHRWEINTSINATIADNLQLAIPFFDVNYGVAPHLQLKAEAPYVLSFDHKQISREFGEIAVGVKFQFLNDSKTFISAGTYPQYVLRGDKGFLLPLLLEKAFGKFLIGEDIGFFFGEHNENNFQLGNLLGYQATDKLQLMAEYFIQKNYRTDAGTAGFINFGFRKILSKTFTIMGSSGTQVAAPPFTEQEHFFCFIGVQTHL
jgi:hypothetical protein